MEQKQKSMLIIIISIILIIVIGFFIIKQFFVSKPVVQTTIDKEGRQIKKITQQAPSTADNVAGIIILIAFFGIFAAIIYMQIMRYKIAYKSLSTGQGIVQPIIRLPLF